MTLADIKTILTSIPGFADKVAYNAWPVNEAPALPWICFREEGSNNFAADGIVYHPILDVTIELYSKNKDTASEALVEQALTNAGIFFDKTETYIEAEKCFAEIYEIEV